MIFLRKPGPTFQDHAPSARHIKCFMRSGKQWDRTCLPGAAGNNRTNCVVMAGLVPAIPIKIALRWSLSELPGIKPGMTLDSLPLAAIGHRNPRLLRRQRVAFLQKFDRVLVR